MAVDRIAVHRWSLVVLCTLAISAGPAAFTLSSFGLTVGGMQAEFGWSRAEASVAITAMMMAVAASMPFVGALVDRFGVRPVLIPSIAGFGALMLMVPFVKTLWEYIALFVVMGVVGAGAGSLAYVRLLASWFDRSRGLAIGLAGSGTGLGFAYVPLLSERAVAWQGWRGPYWLLGGIVLFLVLPAVILVLKPNPALAEDLHDETVSAPVSGLSLTEAARTSDFWLMLATFATVAAVFYGVIPHLVPMLEGRGIPAKTATLVASVFGLATFAGRLLIGWLLDRFEARRVAGLFFALSAIGMALLATPLPIPVVILSAFLLGGSLGAEVDMLAFLVSRYFGLLCFARIFGTLFAVVMVAMATGPVLFGWVFDRTGSYTLVMAAGVPACIIAVVLSALFRSQPPAKKGFKRAAVVEPAA